MFDEVEYIYKPDILKMMLGIAFFGLIGWFCFFEAETGQAYRLDGIDLGVDGSAALFWSVAFGGFAFVVLGVLGVLRSMFTSPKLVIGTDRILLPSRLFWWEKPASCDLMAITRLAAGSIRRQRYLYVYQGTRRLVVMEGMLPEGVTIEQIHRDIVERRRYREHGPIVHAT